MPCSFRQIYVALGTSCAFVLACAPPSQSPSESDRALVADDPPRDVAPNSTSIWIGVTDAGAPLAASSFVPLTPPPAPEAGAPHGGLSPDQIRKVVLASTKRLRACYEDHADASTHGELRLAWKIDLQGHVHDAHLIYDTLRNERISTCVLDVATGWVFDPSTAPTEIAAYPLRFGVTVDDAGAR